MKNKKLLIIEDDTGLQQQLKWCFDSSIEVTLADRRETALAELRRIVPQVVTLDMGLPPDPGGISVGVELIETILRLQPNSKIIVITGREERHAAIQAIGKGAYDFYQKPITAELLRWVVNKAFWVSELEEEHHIRQNYSKQGMDEIITTNPLMQKICRTLEKVGPTGISVLLSGETGTGKELLARSIHRQSERNSQNFSAINCAAIPDNLLESELFGFEKGAFSGATQRKLGKIEIANGGTLFLDEIGDMPFPLQAKILRFLQERVIERIGGTQQIPVDVRVICATHRNLKSMIEKENFREDLFYRICEIEIYVPPLRERTGDASLLAKFFLEKFSKEFNKGKMFFSSAALAAFESYSWPGNVRELINKVKRAIVLSSSNQIQPEDLQIEDKKGSFFKTLKEVKDQAELDAILSTLIRVENNISEAARQLGVTRPTLYTLLEKHNLTLDN